MEVRGLRYHVRRWGNRDAPKLFMLHGWMDVSTLSPATGKCWRRTGAASG